MPIKRFNIPTIIDIEASGFGQLSYPIEVGVITETGKRYCSLIKPLEEWTHWSDEARQLHGISRELLQRKGLGVGQVCYELNQLLAGKTVYSDGWVVDHPWMIKLFHAAKSQMQFSFSSLETILTEPQMERWHQTKQSILDNNPITRHRASTDAELIQNVFVTTHRKSMEFATRV